MTDIVERLRGLAKDWLVRYDGIHEPLNEAADEIERLREALRPFASLGRDWIDDHASDDFGGMQPDDREEALLITFGWIRAARSALEEKE